MSKSVAALVAIALCAGLLAACGDSGSDTTKSTATATVPTGKLGSTLQCTAPREPGYDVTSFTASHIPCAEAQKALPSVLKTKTAPGWKCYVSFQKGQYVAQCMTEADEFRKFTARWTTSST